MQGSPCVLTLHYSESSRTEVDSLGFGSALTALEYHRSILRKLVVRLTDAEVARLEISLVNLKDPGVVGLREEVTLSVEVNETLNGNADETYFSPPDISVHQL